MGLLDLPNTLILRLIPHLDYEREINALCRANRRLYDLLSPVLYAHSNTQQNGGFTLEWAAIHGSVSTARLILEAGAHPNACGGAVWQPFALAAIYGRSEIIELLYERGIDPCRTENDWKNLLCYENLVCYEGGVGTEEEGHPLCMAAACGHLSVVKLLLHYGVPPDLPTGDQLRRTALHLAAEQGYIDVVRVLADVGSSINTEDRKGITPLAIAAQNNHLEVVQLLLSRGADPGIAAGNEWASICMASCSGNINIMRCLIDHGASPNASHPFSELCIAAERGYNDIVDLLLTRFDYVKLSSEPSQQAVLLCVAALTGRTSLLSSLLTEHKYDPNLRLTESRVFFPYHDRRWPHQGPITAVSWAAERNQSAAIDMLHSHGASINPRPAQNDSVVNDDFMARLHGMGMEEDVTQFTGLLANMITSSNPSPETSLLHAVQNGHTEAVATLLAHGADPNTPPGRALRTALTNPPILSLLLSNNADPTIPNPGSNLLASALKRGNLDSLRILLDHPKAPELLANPSISPDSVQRPEIALFNSAISAGEAVFRLLHDRGLITVPTGFSEHATRMVLLAATRSGGFPFVRLLLELGLELRVGDQQAIFLKQAAEARHDPGALLDHLLQNGCSINATDSTDSTALYHTVVEDHQPAMQLLLQRGADPLVSCGGKSALFLAASEGYVGAVHLILAAIEERGLGLDEIERVLRTAEAAMEVDLDEADQDGAWFPPGIVKLLRGFYWRKRYPVPL
ncbi:ankyrin repeat-containing domain protein [Aspergillus californicus]